MVGLLPFDEPPKRIRLYDQPRLTATSNVEPMLVDGNVVGLTVDGVEVDLSKIENAQVTVRNGEGETIFISTPVTNW